MTGLPSANIRKTYITGPGGLLVTDINGEPTYPLANAHGDIVGTTDVAGGFTATPIADEFGKPTTGVPASRLGWLGAHQRYTDQTATGIIRMGVRLYDPNLGRFLSKDSVEGGSLNAYEYAAGDPINNFDLAGTCVAGVFGKNCRNRIRRGWDRVIGKPIHGAASGTYTLSGCFVYCVGVAFSQGTFFKYSGGLGSPGWSFTFSPGYPDAGTYSSSGACIGPCVGLSRPDGDDHYKQTSWTVGVGSPGGWHGSFKYKPVSYPSLCGC